MEEDTQSTEREQLSTARRGFLKAILGVITFFLGLILGIPFIRSLVLLKPGGAKQVWYRVADLSALPEKVPARLNFTLRTEDAYRHEITVQSVWVIRHPTSEVTVFSPVCTHLGCYFKWDAGTGHFECPCHASVFSADGKVLAGPAPRPLDSLPARIENGVLFVAWQRFQVGIKEKVSV